LIPPSTTTLKQEVCRLGIQSAIEFNVDIAKWWQLLLYHNCCYFFWYRCEVYLGGRQYKE